MKRKKHQKYKKYRYMGKAKIILLLAIVAVAALVIWLPKAPDNSSGPKTMVYLPEWDYLTYKDIDYDVVTDICIAFANPDDSGELSTAVPDKDIKKIVRKAHRHGSRVLISIGGGNSDADFVSLTKNSRVQKKFNKHIIDYASRYKLDGIDINVEGNVSTKFWKTYDQWMESLETACHQNNLLLTCAAASWFDSQISDRTFQRFDWIGIMAYDNHEAYNHSDFDYAKSQMEYFSNARHISEEKLLLGIPFYGYRYKDGICTREPASYKDIAASFKKLNTGDEYGSFRYNGIDTVKSKAELGLQYGGVMIWNISQDSSGDKSLINAIKEIYAK